MKSSLFRGLSRVMSSTEGERAVAGWLRKNPLVLAHSIAGSGLPDYVMAEFLFGSDFRADFVALGAFSGGFDVYFFELEPPNTPLFTKKGLPAKRLNQAISQIDSWRSFIERNRETVLRELSKSVKSKELIRGRLDYEPIDNCGWPLYHPKIWLNWHFEIVMGRRSSLSDQDLSAKASFKTHHDIGIMTYDRLLDTARRLDDFSEHS